jgi:hypothetical protein
VTNTETLCFVLGWQGGTVHQVAERLYVPVDDILTATPVRMRELCRLAQQRRDKPASEPAPVPMVLTCPSCNERHVDRGEFATKPHHTHSCQFCGFTWRPAVVPTVGVQFLPGFKDQGNTDAERIAFLEGTMRANGAPEIYLAGLRNGAASASGFQVEIQDQPAPAQAGLCVRGCTLREAIDRAMAAVEEAARGGCSLPNEPGAGGI